jgi:hypothetical protein
MRARNLTSRDLKTKNETVIYEDGKPIYKVFERLGDMTNNDLSYYLRTSENYTKYSRAKIKRN